MRKLEGVTPSWDAVVLVCRDCRKRRNGPKRLKTANVVSEVKRCLHDIRPRPRVVSTSCLGICPKQAAVIGCAGGAVGARLLTLSDVADVAAACVVLFEPLPSPAQR